MKDFLALPAARLTLLTLLLSLPLNRAGGYTNLNIAVYFRYQEVQSTPDHLLSFSNSWANVERQIKVAKVYLETTRNGQLATAAAVTTMKKFFQDRGIQTSGGLGLTANEPNGFQSYCYSTPADREKVKAMTEFTARYFDEIILDDFFFSNCKCDRCIAAKGDRSWTRFRTEQLDRVSRELIIGPARAVNPKVRLIIKYPNWYESFQGAGYDLAVEPKLYDAIYTGTETRDANSGQHLQSYQSYLETQYFNHIKPGGNHGGWIDGGHDVERYAEQMWDTFFAKVPEITLFNSLQIMGHLNQENRVFDPDSSLGMARLTSPIPQPDGSTYQPDMVARIAGCSAELLDRFLGKLGKPVGLATYKPCNSYGEPYLPNYLGMLGVPIDLVPKFPSTAPAVLLTAAASCDHDLVRKTKKYVQAGGRVIATTGLLEALGERGFQDIAEIRVSGRRLVATHFGGGTSGGAAAANDPDLNILLPQIQRYENDNRLAINFNSALSGYPMAISCLYGKGKFCVLAVPDDFADLYRLPQSVLNQIRFLLDRELFVAVDAPNHVSLFAYDNQTFIVQNFLGQPVSSRVSVARGMRLRDLLSGQSIAASSSSGADPGDGARGSGGFSSGSRPSFEVPVAAHSFRVFAVE